MPIEVLEVSTTLPTNLRPVTQHEEYDWLTLVTCKGFDEDQTRYRWRHNRPRGAGGCLTGISTIQDVSPPEVLRTSGGGMC